MNRFSAAVLAVLVYAVALSSPAWAQNVWYVDVNNAVDGDGSSWASATRDLGMAIEMADRGDEVWVAQGVYVPPGDGPDATFQLRSGVGVYGGFVGLETRRRDRDPSTYRTTLTGDRRGDDLSGAYADNSYHVVTGSGTDRSAVLDGFVVTAGRAGVGREHAHGAGMLNVNGSPTVRNVVFRDNHAVAAGGGTANLSGSQPLFVHCSWIRNQGGAMYNDVSAPVVRTSAFIDNVAVDAGGAILSVNDSETVVVASIFEGNVARESNGGALATIGSRMTVVGSAFRANAAPRGNGGAMLNLESTVSIVNSSFVGNRTGRGSGGAFANARSEVEVVNSVLIDNEAGAVAGGSINFGSDVDLTNTIVWGNRAHNHPLQLVTWDNSDVAVGASVVQASGGSGIHYWDARLGRDTDGNLERAPRFLRPPSPGPDDTWGTADDDFGDLRLGDASPALDAGRNAALDFDLDLSFDVLTDQFGQARVQNGQVDIGAVEGIPRMTQFVREGDRVDASHLGVQVAFASLRRPAGLQVTHHPIMPYGSELPERVLRLPDRKQLAVPARWTIELSRTAPGMRADVCFTGLDRMATGASPHELEVHKRPIAGARTWFEQPTDVLASAAGPLVCARNQASFSEYVVLRNDPPAPVRTIGNQIEDEALSLSRLPVRRMTAMHLDLPGVEHPGPTVFRMGGGHPHRRTGRTAVHYTLPQASDVRMDLYTTDGEPVRVLIDGHQEAGPKEVLLDAFPHPPGVYEVRLRALGRTDTLRVILEARR